MLQSISSVFILYRCKTLTGSPDPTHVNGTDKPCICDNKAPRIRRQVASIYKKSDFRAKSSHFGTSTPNTASSSQKKQTTSKTVTSGKVHVPSPRMHSFEDAKIQGGKRANKLRSGRDVDVSDGEQHSPEESSATTAKEPKTSKSGNSVHSGPNKKITDRVKDRPFSNHTADRSNAKSSPKMKHTSKEAPHRKYYMPSNDTKTFQINSKGLLQYLQDPNLIHKPNDKGKLPGSREAPIYHEPGTVSCKTMEDLKKLYPNSFDILGSLKGAYNIRVNPTVKPATHARRKVPIESKEAIDKVLDYLIEEKIITEQVEPTPWVYSVTFLRKPNGEVRVCLDPSNLNKAIIREHHKPMTVEEIAHELAEASLHKGRCFEGISSDTSYIQAFSLDNVQLSQGTASIPTDALWSQNEPRCVSASDGCHSRRVPRSHRNSR